MNPTPLALAADYADALLVVRRARKFAFLLLLILLLVQLGLFFALRYGGISDTVAATQPAGGTQLIRYALSLSTFAGMATSIVLSLVLLTTVIIMLVGRLVGVSHVLSAYVVSLVLLVLLFPWQGFLNDVEMAGALFRPPGILFTWVELAREARFHDLPWESAVLKWTRFVGAPLFGLILLLTVQFRAARGLRMALGESEPETSPAA